MKVLVCKQANASTQLGQYYPVTVHEFRGIKTEKIKLKGGIRFNVINNQVHCGAPDNLPVFDVIESDVERECFLGQPTLVSLSRAKDIMAFAALEIMGDPDPKTMAYVTERLNKPCDSRFPSDLFNKIELDLKNSGLADEWLKRATALAASFIEKQNTK